MKRRLGVLAYALSAARAVIRREDFDVRATVDGVLYQRRAATVMVANFGAVLHDLIRLGPAIIMVEPAAQGSPFTLRFRMTEAESGRLDRLPHDGRH